MEFIWYELQVIFLAPDHSGIGANLNSLLFFVYTGKERNHPQRNGFAKEAIVVLEDEAMSNLLLLSTKITVLAGFLLFISSCAVTERSLEGSTETFENTSDASTDFTSSTSPREDKKESDAQKAKAFAAANFDHLKSDMARGGGEHLAAFSHLLGISKAHQSDFFVYTREQYPVLIKSSSTDSEEMLAKLDTALSAHPEWKQ